MIRFVGSSGSFVEVGEASAPLYLRHRNVWPLGLYRGTLGAFSYHWVLDRNPWQGIGDEL